MKFLKITSIISISCTCLILCLFSFHIFVIADTSQSDVQKIPDKIWGEKYCKNHSKKYILYLVENDLER
jgi:hypothetical protein